MRKTKELLLIEDAVNEYILKHRHNVVVIVDVLAFREKDSEVIDEYTSLFGVKHLLQCNLKLLDKYIKKEKGDFITPWGSE